MSLLKPTGITKALSFKQPFAWLIANGYLLVDDRKWGTQYRGTILIHASRGLYAAYYDYLEQHTDIPLPPKEQLEYGGVVGVANLVLCCRPGNLPQGISREERSHFGGVHGDYYGFLFTKARPLPFMQCAGKLGIFELDTDALMTAPPGAQATLF